MYMRARTSAPERLACVSFGSSREKHSAPIPLVSMAPPVCSQDACSTQTSVLSPLMQVRWAEREGSAWRRDGQKIPHFLFCFGCHLNRWPHDVRTNNRYSRPGGLIEYSFKKYVFGGFARTPAGVFCLTQPPPEPKDSLEPHTKRHKRNVKPIKHVRWQDHGAWSRDAANWSRDLQQRLLDLETARTLKLVTALASGLDVIRRNNYYRLGPCDGCGSSTVSRQALDGPKRGALKRDRRWQPAGTHVPATPGAGTSCTAPRWRW